MDFLKILIAVRHQILRDGLEKILADEPNFSVEGTAKDKGEFFALSLDEGGILILDLNISDMQFSDLIVELNEAYPTVKILVVSEKKNPEHIKRIMQAGASGYIFKRRSSNELVEAIRKIGEGETYLCDEIMQLLLREGNVPQDADCQKNLSADLTDRELEVLSWV